MGFQAEEIDHIAIAVPDLDAAVHAATTLLGAKLLWRHPPKERAINDGAVLELGGMLIVLEHPLGERGVFAEFLRRRGPGIHHVGVSVTNLDAAMEDAERCGARLVNPALDNPVRREVLVHPKSGLGVLWQMIEWSPEVRPDRQRRRNALRDGEFVVPGLAG
ncbi:MAG TPA: VOC family protein [Dehalococcoidia bacterium]|jgi:methylmalonyl-CoA/ethylmalonyl-CoA epimerase